MDIPNNPKSIKLPTELSRQSSTGPNSPSPRTSISLDSVHSFTTSKELNLPVGAQVLAKVLGEVNNGKLMLGADLELTPDGRLQHKPASANERATASLDNKLSLQSDPTKTARQWLLDIDSKYLLAKTSFALNPGQTIGLQGLENHGLKLLPNAPIGSQELIRQALVYALPQQVSLQSGLELMNQLAGLKPLTQILSDKLALSTLGEQQAVKAWAGILQHLVQRQALPQSGSGKATNISGDQIKQWLNNSGLLAESGPGIRNMQLVPGLSANQARVLQLAGHQLLGNISPNTLKLLTSAFELAGASINAHQIESLDGSSRSLSTETHTKLNELAAHAKLIEAQQARLHALLNTIDGKSNAALATKINEELTAIIRSSQSYQDAFVSARAQLLSGHAGLTESAHQQLIDLTRSIPIGTNGDLKSSLVKLVVAMQTALTPGTHDAKVSSRGLSENDLLTQAFDFPKLDLSINKATSILADQELNTGQLLKLAAALLNRIQFNQLNSLSQAQATPDAPTQSWNFELPFVTAQQQLTAFSLRLEREPEKGSNGKDSKHHKTQWNIVLAFDLEDLGPMYIETCLIPPTVKTKIWADLESTATLIQQEQTVLEDKLTSIGLEVEELQCLRGKPAPQNNPIKQNLVDIQA